MEEKRATPLHDEDDGEKGKKPLPLSHRCQPPPSGGWRVIDIHYTLGGIPSAVCFKVHYGLWKISIAKVLALL